MILYREATIEEVPILRQLEQEVVKAEIPFNDCIKEEGAIYYDLEDLISNPKSLMLVGESDGKIVATGYAQIRPSKQSLTHDLHSYLGFMLVQPSHRGQGINQEIIKRLIQWSKDQGVYDLYLDVYAGNASAIRAYEKIGFEASVIEMKLNIADF